MMTINKFHLIIPCLAVFSGACAPDSNVVSDAERLNIFCSTKKNDSNSRCESDEVRLDYRDVAIILVQKLTREVSVQMSVMKKNTVIRPEDKVLIQNKLSQNNLQIINKKSVRWKTEVELDDREFLIREIPVSLTSNLIAKDIGSVQPDVEQLDLVQIMQGLTKSFDELLNMSRVDSKSLAQQHGTFVLMSEKNNYKVTEMNVFNRELDVQWSGGGHGIFSKLDAKRGKYYYSNDQITENGELKTRKTSLSSDKKTQIIDLLRLDWNFAVRSNSALTKDTILNFGIESFAQTVSVVEVEEGCFRLVGELRMKNTEGGVKKKPAKEFNSKIVLTATSIEIYNGNADGSFKSKPAKTEAIPACSEYDGMTVNYGLAI